MEGQNLKSICDEKAGETNVVKDAEEPDEDDLGISGGGVGVSHTAGG